MQPSVPEPVFINLEYFFFLTARSVKGFFEYIFSREFVEQLHFFATILVILFIAFVIYLLVRLYELKQESDREAERAARLYTPDGLPGSATVAFVPSHKGKEGEVQTISRNETWEAIRTKLLSDNQSDWRLGIIEADIYMDKLLDERGFHGDTTSDKLKQVTTGDLASIQIAWEAHKVRNRIAHDGVAFDLSQPEARRILSYFEIVFRDLGAIQ